MQLPVKDRQTVPWMSQRKIPAIKAALSAWRRRRKEPAFAKEVKDEANWCGDPLGEAYWRAESVAGNLEFIAAVDELMRKETKNAK